MKKVFLTLGILLLVTCAYAGVERTILVNGSEAAIGTTANPLIVSTSGASSFSGDITVTGNTPTITIGDAGAEDTDVVFDGNAQDFYIGLDDTDDDLKIGLGSAVGTTPAIIIGEDLLVTHPGATTLTGATTVTGALTANGAIIAGYEMVTTSSADPGVGVASVTKLFTDITSDATGSAADAVSLAAGAAGQIKVIQLAVDGETTGTSITANFFGATAAALMEDAGDVLILISDGTEWHIILNTGCTLS